MSKEFIKRFSLIKDIIMFICLIGLMLTPYLLRWPVFGRSWYFLGWNWHFSSWHQLFGIVLTVCFVTHICLNFKWLTGTTKAWAKANAGTKAKFWMMMLVLLTMGASIITGIIWGLGSGAQGVFSGSGNFPIFGSLDNVQFWHTITSWAAFYFTGIHIGLHLTKFLTFVAKPKKPAPKPPAAPAA
ncbi:MAG: hypothetical protein FWC67_02160 [Defluviitaleaceae bacterium]|nr:hypothetical protein [Defluviitaleaceae bacterium]